MMETQQMVNGQPRYAGQYQRGEMARDDKWGKMRRLRAADVPDDGEIRQRWVLTAATDMAYETWPQGWNGDARHCLETVNKALPVPIEDDAWMRAHRAHVHKGRQWLHRMRVNHGKGYVADILASRVERCWVIPDIDMDNGVMHAWENRHVNEAAPTVQAAKVVKQQFNPAVAPVVKVKEETKMDTHVKLMLAEDWAGLKAHALEEMEKANGVLEGVTKSVAADTERLADDFERRIAEMQAELETKKKHGVLRIEAAKEKARGDGEADAQASGHRRGRHRGVAGTPGSPRRGVGGATWREDDGHQAVAGRDSDADDGASPSSAAPGEEVVSPKPGAEGDGGVEADERLVGDGGEGGETRDEPAGEGAR